LRIDDEFNLTTSAVGTCPTSQRNAGDILSYEPPQLVCMLDATRRVVAFIATKHDERREAKRVRSLRKLEAVFEGMFGRQDGNDEGALRLRPNVDGHVPQVRFFAAANGTVCQKNETTKRGN